MKWTRITDCTSGFRAIKRFYLLSYPRLEKVTVGSGYTIPVAVVNHEAQPMIYRFEVWIGREKVRVAEWLEGDLVGVEGLAEVIVDPEERKETRFWFFVERANPQRAEVRLYKTGDDEPIRTKTFRITKEFPEG